MPNDNTIFIPQNTHFFTKENIPYFFNDFLIQCGATKFLLPASMQYKYEEWKLPEYIWKRTKFLPINEVQKFENEIFDYYKDVNKFNKGYNEEKYQHKINPILSLISKVAICNKYGCSTVDLFNPNHINDLKEVVSRLYRKEVSIPLINILDSLSYNKISTVKLTSNIDNLRIDEIFHDSDFFAYSNHHANLHDKRFSLPEIFEEIRKTSNLLVNKFSVVHENQTVINILEKTIDIGTFEFYIPRDHRIPIYDFSDFSKISSSGIRRLNRESPESGGFVPPAPIPAPI